jgi:hypothetical protein
MYSIAYLVASVTLSMSEKVSPIFSLVRPVTTIWGGRGEGSGGERGKRGREREKRKNRCIISISNALYRAALHTVLCCKVVYCTVCTVLHYTTLCFTPRCDQKRKMKKDRADQRR